MKLDLILRAKECKINLIAGHKICTNCLSTLNQSISDYQTEYLNCVDPYEKHRFKMNSGLVILNLEFISFLETVHNKKYTTDHKICNACENQIQSEFIEYAKEKLSSQPPIINSCTEFSNNSSESPNTESTAGSSYDTASQKKRNFDAILDVCGIPPFKRLKLNNDRIATNGINIVEDVACKVSESFEEAYGVQIPRFENLQQMQNESSWFNDMITGIKLKYNESKNVGEKISLLTLLPDNWSFTTVSKYFNCTYYIYA
ncbi:uncharacterized protein LOC131675543 [Phymastichus coffea]|uniref:uncharacterized protein LOC131675543 n=1 Tax=Phymastichus coffea TaxID=108790 RepID=UPI00273AB35C|nr:uncharacterized protein LOC131675543 [Phymastichus coffea]